jgi:DNA-directed RNA polymerase specialized sigma24 family protein
VQVRAEWISFYDTHYHRVVRSTMHAGASLPDAQDATQEAFTESWKLMIRDSGAWQAINGQTAWGRTVALRRHARPLGSRHRPPPSFPTNSRPPARHRGGRAPGRS